MSQAGIDVGQNRKPKQKRKYNKGKKRKNKR